MTLEVVFNLNLPDSPPTWVAPFIESVLAPLFTAQVQGIQVSINIGGAVPTPAQSAAIKTLQSRIDMIDSANPPVSQVN